VTRLFLPPEKLTEEKIMITGDEARYLSLVLRAMPGDKIIIFDGSGCKYECRILKVHKKEVVAEKIKKELYSAESPISITLAQGLPKSGKMDFIIQKATELGVSIIVPLITERSQLRHTEKVARWRKIAVSASQQCGRDKIPEVCEPVEFEKFIRNTPLTPLDIIFSEEQNERNLKKVLTDFKDAKNITLLIGPEGGFSIEEVSSAVGKGFIEASLGPRILRTETAPLTAISIIQYELGDIG